MNQELQERLLALAARPVRARLNNDPVAFVHRYTDPKDQEIAGIIAAGLAYGRVALFRPVIARILDRADACGGPRAWVESFSVEREQSHLEDLVYRFNRWDSLSLWWSGLRRLALQADGLLGDAVHMLPGEEDVLPALSRWVHTMREASLGSQDNPMDWGGSPRGLRYLLVDPADGSAAKRLWMFARWMVRPADGVDVGLWRHIEPRFLRMPIDTHVHRISLMLGLTLRRSANGKTSLDVTNALRVLDPADPVRFDFALAHLGISDGCSGVAVRAVCDSCPLVTVCTVGRPPSRSVSG